jgi:hydrogenase maturation protein HypF
MHPNYFTTQWAQWTQRSNGNARFIPVQHHHAHIASCMADNKLDDRKLIGLSFDGTGYGTDGAIWGGEILLASYADFERVAHLEYLPLPGADSATRNPWRIAVGYAESLGLDITDLPFLESVDSQSVNIVRQQVRKKLNAPLTSSIGRLFDAISSLIGIRNQVTYEAQAAIEMEVLSRKFIAEANPYPFEIEDGIIRVGELFKQVIQDVRSNHAAGFIGARFHHTVCAMAVEASQCVRQKNAINEVALSGGVWQNQILLDLTRSALLRENFVVYTHQQTPANDGGLALGQAVIANFQ